MEYIDIYDKDGYFLNRTKKRDTPLVKGEYYKVVGTIILDEENNVIFTRRSPCKKSHPYCWETTGGGVQAGESPLTAIIREIREETNIEVSPSDIIVLFKETQEPACRLLTCYGVKINSQLSSIVLDRNETIDYVKVPFEHFLEFINNPEFASNITLSLTRNYDKILSNIRPLLEKEV